MTFQQLLCNDYTDINDSEVLIIFNFQANRAPVQLLYTDNIYISITSIKLKSEMK